MGDGRRQRRGIRFYGRDDAPLLHETPVMSFPVLTEPAGPQFAEWAGFGGHCTKVLFSDPEESGMSLVWAWFGPGFVLPRHSHSADCLYYVVAGEARLGSRVVPKGEGFFVPADAPYAYTAGPEGVQVLEFRGVSSFDMKISESVERWDHIVSVARARSTEWAEAAPR
jgi:hypothetical protein